MSARSVLVGRGAERAQLEEALARARDGEGSVLLLGGEAGVGKSRLAAEVAAASGALVLHGASRHGGTAPYEPVAGALRSYLRVEPEGLADCGPLRSHLALLLPELGDPPQAADRATLFEAVRCALARVAEERHVVVILDDLEWSDEATLELLGALAEPVTELAMLVIAVYRSDGLPRDHGLRRLRHELRRAGRLRELTVPPLDEADTGELLAAVLGAAPSRSLTRTIHDRTQGVPFFVEELARALRLSGSLTAGADGLDAGGDGEVPLPETVRDAVAIGAAGSRARPRTAPHG